MKRWVTSRKAQLINDVKNGEIELADALLEHGISPDEWNQWVSDYAKGGELALRTTRISHRRKNKGIKRPGKAALAKAKAVNDALYGGAND